MQYSIHNVMMKELLKELKNIKLISITADETSNRFCDSHLHFAIKWVDTNMKPQIRFIKIAKLNGKTAEKLCDAIKDIIFEFELEGIYVIFFEGDTTNTNSGKKKGLII